MAWQYKATLTIDKDKCGSENTSNFPMLVSGVYDGTGGEPDLRHSDHGGKVTSTSGYDICFYSDSSLTTQLDHEIESYNHETGEIKFWVEVPTLSVSSDTDIYMGYSDSGVTTSQEDVTGTWDSNYKAIWHLNDANYLVDSTGNHALTNSSSTDATGIVAKGRAVSGGQYLYTAASDDFNLDGTDFVWEVWFNFTGSGYQGLLAQATDGGHYQWLTNSYNNQRLHYDEAAHGINGATTLSTGVWNYVAFCKFGGHYYFYLNGASSPDADLNYSGAMQYFGGNFCIANLTPYNFCLNGSIDEVRITKGTGRTVSYFTASYNSIYAPSTFYAMGDEIASNSAPNTPTNSTPANAATNQSRQLTLTGSAYSDPESNAHTASQWQVATDSGMTSLVWDSGETATNKTSIVVNSTNGTFEGALSGKTKLSPNTTYYWRVRYKD